jgi:hypothetical protein
VLASAPELSSGAYLIVDEGKCCRDESEDGGGLHVGKFNCVFECKVKRVFWTQSQYDPLTTVSLVGKSAKSKCGPKPI